MPAIPLDSATLAALLNLPLELTANPVFAGHQPLVLERLRGLTTSAAFASALSDNVLEPLGTAFRFGYAFLLLASVAEFLNLKTLGEGIVKTTGFAADAPELLTGAELEAFKLNLERRALEALQPWLSPAGLERLDVLCDRVGHRVRAVLI